MVVIRIMEMRARIEKAEVDQKGRVAITMTLTMKIKPELLSDEYPAFAPLSEDGWMFVERRLKGMGVREIEHLLPS